MQILWARTRPRRIWRSAWNFPPWFPHMSRWYRAWSFFFSNFFSPRKSTSSEDIFPLSFVGGFGLTESLLFLDSVLSCPDPVAIDTSFVTLVERCVFNPRPGKRKICFPCQVTKWACFTRRQRWKRTCAVRRGGFRYDTQIEVSCSFFLI